MESCLLCLQLDREAGNSIKVSSTSWKTLEITQVLWKHFWKLNTIQPESWICFTCWQVVESFHQLYLKVEEAHSNLANIKVEMLEPKEEILDQEAESFDCLKSEIVIEENILQENIRLETKEEILSHETENFGCIKSEILIEEMLEPKEEMLSQETESFGALEIIRNEIRNLKNEELIGQGEKDQRTKTTMKVYSPRKVSLGKTKAKKTRKTNKSLKYYENNEKNNSEPETNTTNNEETNTENSTDKEEHSDGNSKPAVKSSKEERRTQKDQDNFIAKHLTEISCDICKCPLESFSFVLKHFLKEHNQKGYIVCCNRKIYNRNLLVDHLQCHSNPNFFKCSECGKILSNSRSLKSHMFYVHSKNEVVLKHFCEICKRSFAKAQHLKAHKLTHATKEEKKFPCTECGKFYASSYLLKAHIEYTHLKRYTKICHICGITLENFAEYRAHVKKHEAGIEQPVIDCDVCGLRLTSERTLKQHKKIQHPIGGRKEHPCPLCPKKSYTHWAMRTHFKTSHQPKCAVCERTFENAEALKKHMAKLNHRPVYTCIWCPVTYSSKSSMYAHRKRVHPKEWLEAKLK